MNAGCAVERSSPSWPCYVIKLATQICGNLDTHILVATISSVHHPMKQPVLSMAKKVKETELYDILGVAPEATEIEYVS